MLRICDDSECGTLTLGRFCVFHEPPSRDERFPRGRPFDQGPLPLVEGDERGEGLHPALLAAAAADAAEMEPIRAVSLEGGS
jgi:hypothetical protein